MSTATLISVQELAAWPSGAAVILDCRFQLADPQQGRREYLRGHIPGAHYADLDHDLSAPRQDPELGRHPLPDGPAFARCLARWGWRPALPVVAYDDAGGAFAARAWWLLQLAGCRQAMVLDGGWTHWCAAALPQATGATVPSPGAPPSIHWDERRVLRTPALQQALLDRKTLLLDARAQPRYAGQHEPIDPFPGHVPGAINRPFADNLQADGCFHRAAELRQVFAAILGSRDPAQVIHMCGSGVTACHNLLAMEHAGLVGSRLYAPSWSGWCSDPQRPRQTLSACASPAAGP